MIAQSATASPAYFQPGAIMTRSGLLVRPLALRAEDIRISDIAHALALQNRFTGHTSAPYSVAQHSIHVAQRLGKEGAARPLVQAALLHDASEAYLMDLPTPLKALPEFAVFKDAELLVQEAIEDRFGVPPGLLSHSHIKRVDKRMCATEAASLMPPGFAMSGIDAYPERIVPWAWTWAENAFLLMAQQLGIE